MRGLRAPCACAATVAPSLWLVPTCDMISTVYLAPLWAALGIAAAARAGGLDRGRAGVALVVSAMPLAALAVAPVLLALPSSRDREAAAIVVGALALATTLALLQVRTLPFAAMFAAAPLAAAAALAIARRWRLRLDPIWGYAAAACLANPFAIMLAAAVAAEPVLGSQAQHEAHAGERLCTRRAEYRVLAGLPPGTVAGLISFGSYISPRPRTASSPRPITAIATASSTPSRRSRRNPTRAARSSPDAASTTSRSARPRPSSTI